MRTDKKHMKALIYAIIVSISAQSQSNVYHPMLSDTTAEWIYSQAILPNAQFYKKVSICGTITYTNNKTYKILCRDAFQGSGNPYVLLGRDSIFLREDTINKKVFILKRGDNYCVNSNYSLDAVCCNNCDTIYGICDKDECLIYDYDVYVGKPLNTLYHSDYYCYGLGPDVVGCVDSTLMLDGTYRKYYTYAPTLPNGHCGDPAGYALTHEGSVIEGIGNINNPFWYWNNWFLLNGQMAYPVGGILCYKKHGMVLWFNYNLVTSTSDICNPILTVNQYNNIFGYVKVFPTVVTDRLMIESSYGFLSVKLLDISGKVVKDLGTAHKGMNYYDVEEIANGLYLVQMTMTDNKNKRIKYEKVVVSR